MSRAQETLKTIHDLANAINEPLRDWMPVMLPVVCEIAYSLAVIADAIAGTEEGEK